VVGQNIIFTVSVTGGTINPTAPQTVATNALGEASVVYEFTDSAPAGGYYVVTACADVSAPFGACSGEPIATTITYMVDATFTSTPNPFDVPEANAGGTNTGVDGFVRVQTTGPDTPTTAALKVVLEISDTFPVSGNNANGSFAACNNTDGTDKVSATVNHTVPFDQNVWACHYVNGGGNDTFQVKAYWDVNGNGNADTGEPQISGSPIAVTIVDS
jgi:hypothetical protein